MVEHQVKKEKIIVHGKWWDNRHAESWSRSILKSIADFIEILPSSLKKPAIKFIDKTGLYLSRLMNILSFFYFPTVLIDVRLSDLNSVIRILYRGEPDSIDEIIGLLCKQQNDMTITQVKKQKSFSGSSERSDFDLIICKNDLFYKGFFQRKKYVVIPEYVSMVLDIKKPIDDLLDQVSISILQDIKKAKVKGYTVEIAEGEKIFSSFYHDMYLPYTNWKHDKKSKVATVETIRHLMLQGSKLLLLKHDDEFVFGGMFLIDKKMVRTHYAGLMKGKYDHLHHGVMALSYVYLIEIAKQHGCKSIDFGTARPFLDDGLFSYKSKWNMNIRQTSYFLSDMYGIKIRKKSDAMENLFIDNPFFFYNANTLATAFITHRSRKKKKQQSQRRTQINQQIPAVYKTIDEM